jgi:UDP-2,3-diacylglucosamine hydrolase
MATYFVSDFHLGEADPSRDQTKYRLFCNLLSKAGSDLEHLVILGDLYDFWFEYRHLVPKHNLQIPLKLKELVEAGTKVSYVCGNHDFWMGDFFETELGVGLIHDEFCLESPSGKVLVLHGDGIAPSDWKYRILKKILRNPVNIALYRLLPPNIAYRMALTVSRGSRGHTEKRPKDSFVEEYFEFAQRQFAKGYFAVVCGHLHLPEIRKSGDKFYVNSGDWLTHYSYVRFDGSEFLLGYAENSP